MNDVGKYLQWWVKVFFGQGSFLGEVGVQLSLEEWIEGIWRDIYMGEMESYKGK